MTQKTAVILMNLGGPDKPESIRPFLVNFFMDRNIIRAPWLVRFFLSRRIANRRSKNEAGTAYGRMGGKSPLLENTTLQATALQKKLGDGYRVFVCMRYWHPMADEVVREVKDWAPDQILLLPLYPQYSTTTSRSSIQDWNRAALKEELDIPTSALCCYPLDGGFVVASADRIAPVYAALEKETGQKPRVLFSAHGLPEKIIKGGDPYQAQCEDSAKAIAEKLGLSDWMVCYQSRVGPLKWIGPSTEEALHQAAADKVPVVIYPHAFVSEHVETIVEIGEEYKHLAHEIGVPGFARVETVGTHPAFIEGLAGMVRQSPPESRPSTAGVCLRNPRRCPMRFSQCCHSEIDRL